MMRFRFIHLYIAWFFPIVGAILAWKKNRSVPKWTFLLFFLVWFSYISFLPYASIIYAIPFASVVMRFLNNPGTKVAMGIITLFILYKLPSKEPKPR